jgi:aminoglycoside phosphotransferase (APT) family kinase protein
VAALTLTPTSEGLDAYLAHRLAEPGLRVTSVRMAGQGLSDDTLVVTVQSPAQAATRRLVVRRYRPEGVLREETDPERHFRVLRSVQATGVPVPRVLWYEPDPAPLGGPAFVMEHVDGTVPVPWTPQGRSFLADAGRGPIGEQFTDILAAIHAIDWREAGLDFLGVPGPGTAFAARRVDDMERLLERHADEPEPVLEDAIGWMRAHLPESPHTVLVHGDYRTGNLIYRDDRIVAVLDWEFATLGDPACDLAWVCARSNRMDSDLACYLLPLERVLDGYAERTGLRPDPGALHFWEVFHQVRNALIWVSAGRSYASGRTGDLRFLRMAYSVPVMRRMVAELLDYP